MGGAATAPGLLGTTATAVEIWYVLDTWSPCIIMTILMRLPGASSAPAPEDALAFHTQFEGTSSVYCNSCDRRTSCRSAEYNTNDRTEVERAIENLVKNGKFPYVSNGGRRESMPMAGGQMRPSYEFGTCSRCHPGLSVANRS